MACKHAALAAIYAKQMAEMDEPWKLWERQWGAEWEKLETHPDWNDRANFRQTPKTILINGIEVPEPMREKPTYGTRYFYVDARKESGAGSYDWKNDEWDNAVFNSTGIHISLENCIIHAKALFSFSEVK